MEMTNCASLSCPGGSVACRAEGFLGGANGELARQAAFVGMES